jgi:hypothetical protein
LQARAGKEKAAEEVIEVSLPFSVQHHTRKPEPIT